MKNVRVLLVDDEKEFVELLKERLESRGAIVDAAFDGYQALEHVSKDSFDAIILDLNMPGMDGLQTLEKILAKDSDAQVILLTGYGTLEKGVEAVKHGATDFLEKPMDVDSLMSRIDDAALKRTTLLEERSMEKIEEIMKKKGW